MCSEECKKSNRRKVLRSFGASTAAVVGLSTVVGADERSLSSTEIQNTLQKPEVKQISELVEDFSIDRASKSKVIVSEKSITSVEIECERGKLTYAESASGTAEASFVVESLSSQSDLRRHLLTTYGNVPKQSDVALISNRSSVDMIRTVTKNEARRLRAVLGQSGEMFTASYDSEIQGYRVVTGNPDVDETADLFTVGENGRGISHRHVENVNENVDENNISPLGCDSWSCGSCGMWAVSRGICYWSCVKSVGLTCVACIKASNLSFPFACRRCFETCL